MWKTKAREFYNNNFYAKNDAGHSIRHADDVYSGMREVNVRLDLNLKDDLIFMIAYIHDIFSSVNRKTHHTLARQYILEENDNYLSLYSHKEKEIMGAAVYEHRSSGNCKFSNDYSLAIKIADKGKPNLVKTIIRSYQYHKQTETEPQAINNVIKHLQDKFSRDGYAFKCDFYVNYYKDELKSFWKELDGLTENKVITILNENKVR